jgi:hypothetical protein
MLCGPCLLADRLCSKGSEADAGAAPVIFDEGAIGEAGFSGAPLSPRVSSSVRLAAWHLAVPLSDCFAHSMSCCVHASRSAQTAAGLAFWLHGVVQGPNGWGSPIIHVK